MLDLRIRDYGTAGVILDLFVGDSFVGTLRVAQIQRVHDIGGAGKSAVFLYDRADQYAGVLNGVVSEHVEKPVPPHNTVERRTLFAPGMSSGRNWPQRGNAGAP